MQMNENIVLILEEMKRVCIYYRERKSEIFRILIICETSEYITKYDTACKRARNLE